MFLSGCQPADRSKELVVGMDLSYPPFEMIDSSGKPTGVSVELAEALSRHLGRTLRVENMPFTGLIPSLQNGRLDCVISSMTASEERRKSIDFSQAYLKTGLALLVREDGVMDLADLDQQGRTIVVRQGTTGEMWAKEHLQRAKLLSVEKENSAVLEVVQGRADAFIYDQMSVWQNARKAEKLKAILTPLRIEEWAIGVRKGNQELLDQINAFLQTHREEGGFERLGDQYLKEQKASFNEQGIPFVF